MFAPISMEPVVFEKVKDVDFDNDLAFFNEKCNKCVLKVSCPACCGNNLMHKGALNEIDDFYCRAFIIQYLRNVDYQLKKAEGIKDETERRTVISDLRQMANAITIY